MTGDPGQQFFPVAIEAIVSLAIFLSDGIKAKRLGWWCFEQMIDRPEQLIVQRLSDVCCKAGWINKLCFPITNTLLVEDNAELIGPLGRHLTQDGVRSHGQLC